jgi:hypothetical protein
VSNLDTALLVIGILGWGWWVWATHKRLTWLESNGPDRDLLIRNGFTDEHAGRMARMLDQEIRRIAQEQKR